MRKRPLGCFEWQSRRKFSFERRSIAMPVAAGKGRDQHEEIAGDDVSAEQRRTVRPIAPLVTP